MSLVERQQDTARALLEEADALVARGPGARRDLTRLADRGDWRERTLAVSALGRLARHDRHLTRRFSLLADVFARVPRLRASLPTVGRQGRLVIGTIHNALSAPFFPTRIAAALAVGDCRHVGSTTLLTAMLSDRFVPVRRAAAVGLAALGRTPTAPVGGHASTPAEIMPGEHTAVWLTHLTARHPEVFAEAAAVHGLGPTATAEALAAWLTGETEVLGTGGSQAEADRYAEESDLDHQARKPFSAHDLAESLQQLDAFVALAAHLDLPPHALVLDLGGGSGWVAELLARFGFRTAVLDVSLPLLRLARTRLSPGAIPAVAADMTALPLRPESADAVMIIDALHHVGDVEAVVREAHRVLRRGGVFLVAEPGQGHPESPQSLAEARHHGVREGAIDPQLLGQAARVAGFTTIDLLPRVPAIARMPVARIPSAIRSPAESWMVEVGSSVTRFDALAMGSMLARPLMVMRKGQAPTSSASAEGLRATIALALSRKGAQVTGTAELRNIGQREWRRGDGSRGAINVGIQLLSADGAMVSRDFARVALPRNVPPGAHCTVPMQLTIPDANRRYRLKVDLVAEQVCWLEEMGSEPSFVDV